MSKLTINTPKGVAYFPRLKNADTGLAENGIYKADIVVSEEVGRAFIKTLANKLRENGMNPKLAGTVVAKHKVKDEDGIENETGELKIKASVKNIVTKKGELWDKRPAQFDAKGNPIRDHKDIGSGSILRLSCSIHSWTYKTKSGITLQPEAVQVIELKEFIREDRDAAGYGFGEEDGYDNGADASDAPFAPDEACDDIEPSASDDDGEYADY